MLGVICRTRIYMLSTPRTYVGDYHTSVWPVHGSSAKYHGVVYLERQCLLYNLLVLLYPTSNSDKVKLKVELVVGSMDVGFSCFIVESIDGVSDIVEETHKQFRRILSIFSKTSRSRKTPPATTYQTGLVVLGRTPMLRMQTCPACCV